MKITNLEQVEALMDLYRSVIEEHKRDNLPLAGYRNLPEDKIRKIFLTAMSGDPGWFDELIINPSDQKIVGVLIGAKVYEYLTGDIVAQEILAYVHPDYRNPANSKRAFEVIDQFESWAKSVGAMRISMLTYGNYVDMLQRVGYVPYATAMYKEIV